MLEKLKVTALDNGIRVVSYPEQDSESVRMGIFVRVGSRNERLCEGGVSHFIEHMLFRGTAKRTARAISEAIEGHGGDMNAWTSQDTTCFYAKVPHNKATSCFGVLGDLFYHSTFEARALERERHVIAEEIRMYADQPDTVAQERLMAQLWEDHPLGRPILGTMESVLAMKREQLVDYWQTNYVPSRMVFAFGGRVKHERCVAMVERLAGHLKNPANLREPEVFSRAIPMSPFSLERRVGIQQAQLAMGWRTPGWTESTRLPAVAYLSCILGETMFSRLPQRLRERLGLCYSVNSGVTQMFDCGALQIAAGCDPERALKATTAILSEVRSLIERPISAVELRKMRNYLCGRYRLRMDAPLWGVATRILFGIEVDPEGTLARLEGVTAADIQREAATLLTPENLVMAAVLPQNTVGSTEQWMNVTNY